MSYTTHTRIAADAASPLDADALHALTVGTEVGFWLTLFAEPGGGVWVKATVVGNDTTADRLFIRHAEPGFRGIEEISWFEYNEGGDDIVRWPS